MTGKTSVAVPSIAAQMQLIQMATAYRVSQAVYAASALRLGDHLAAGPKAASELAGAIKAHAPSLHRLMRTLASLGVLTERSDHRFALTPLGEALKSDAPESARAAVLTLAGPAFWRAWEHFLYSVQTGKTGWQKAWGLPLFDYFAQHPDQASLLSETMVAFHGNEAPAVANAYDFSAIQLLVDVGGATGNMLAAILARHPQVRGVLCDLPHVVQDAPKLLKAKGLRERVTIAAGDFFEAVPQGGDAYLLSHVLHDWPDDKCLAILENCRKAMKAGKKLLVVEMILPPGDTPHPGKMLDLSMLVGAGGQERTEEEYSALIAQAGFRTTRTVPTDSAVAVLEAAAV
jgi:O-methyltransferase/methyltransferase family protein